jgi:hypothetical protein
VLKKNVFGQKNLDFIPIIHSKCSLGPHVCKMLDFGPSDLPPFAFCGPLGNFDQKFSYMDFFCTYRNVIGQLKKLIFHFKKIELKIEGHMSFFF